MERDKNKINILFFIDYLYGFGGTERHLFNLASRLNPDLFDSTVCPLRFNKYLVKIFTEAGIKVEPAPFKRIYDFSALKQVPVMLQLMRERQIDIVQTFNIDSETFGIILAKLSGVPVIISSRRDLGVYRKRRHLLFSKFIHRYVDHFLAVCDAVASNLSEREGVPPEKITTIYNGLDLTNLPVDQNHVAKLRKEFRIGPNSFVIGNVSHFRPEKGYDVFFNAIQEIKPYIPDLRVMAVGGGGKLLTHFKNVVAKAGLSEVVFFTGYVPNVLDYVSLMDVCCLTPISNEGFSNAILEHMAMGKAVIATDVGGNREAICHGESGIIIPANDVKALADAIINLYKNPTLRKSLGANARLRVEREFTIQKMITQMEKFYYNLYEKNGNEKILTHHN